MTSTSKRAPLSYVRTHVFAGGVLAMIALSGCPGTDGGGSVACNPGATAPCMCGVASGMQTCAADGKSFSVCDCGAAQTAGTVATTAGTLATAGTMAGTVATAGTMAGVGTAGTDGTAGTFAGTMSVDGGVQDAGDADAAVGSNPETGRLAGITAAHNAVRAGVDNPVPSTPIPPLAWSSTLAATAQAYAEKLATTGNCDLVHSGANGLGENIAYYGGSMASPEDVVGGWASEDACWTYGDFMKNDACNMTCTTNVHSNGCGHYTQVVWRATTEVGCGVADCAPSGPFSHREIWVCNYTPQGNYIGQKPY